MCNHISRYDDVMSGIGHFFVKIVLLFAFSKTGWAHRDRMGISLLGACMYDVRDTLVYESQLEKFRNLLVEQGRAKNPRWTKREVAY